MDPTEEEERAGSPPMWQLITSRNKSRSRSPADDNNSGEMSFSFSPSRSEQGGVRWTIESTNRDSEHRPPVLPSQAGKVDSRPPVLPMTPLGPLASSNANHMVDR